MLEWWPDGQRESKKFRERNNLLMVRMKVYAIPYYDFLFVPMLGLGNANKQSVIKL